MVPMDEAGVMNEKRRLPLSQMECQPQMRMISAPATSARQPAPLRNLGRLSGLRVPGHRRFHVYGPPSATSQGFGWADGRTIGYERVLRGMYVRGLDIAKTDRSRSVPDRPRSRSRRRTRASSRLLTPALPLSTFAHGRPANHPSADHGARSHLPTPTPP